MDVGSLSNRLRRNGAGIWTTAGPSEPGSFPAAAHAELFQFEDDSFWFRHRNACLLEMLRRFPPHGAIFDLGGGNGYVARALAVAGFENVLLEPGPEGAANARSRGLENVVCSRLEDAGFRDGTIPAAGMFDVLEHIEDDVSFLRLLHRLLADDARIYLTVPSYPLLWSGVDVYSGHFRRHTRRTLNTTLTAAGFRLEHATYYFAPLVVPVFLFRSLPHRLGARNTASREQHVPPAGVAFRLMQWLLSLELRVLRSGRTIPFGSSLMAVARRV